MADDDNLSVNFAVLALDAAGGACSAALWRDGRVVARRFAEMEHGQAEALIPMVQAVMAEAGMGYATLDLIAVSTGPGSYTGVRVGIASARSIASASGKPLSGVSSFDCIRAGVTESGPLLVALETRRSDLYIELFDIDGRVLDTPAVVSEAELIARFGGTPPILVAGDAAGRAAAMLENARIAAAPRHADAAKVAEIAAFRWLSEKTPRPAEPIYLRPPDARTVAERAAAPTRLISCGFSHGPVLAILQQRCFEERWSAEAMNMLLSQPGVVGILLVAEGAENPMGYGLMRVVAGEAEILTFGVDPRYRRAGHGGRILAEILARSRTLEVSALFLEVAEKNTAARALYESRGFRLAGRRIGYYRGPRGVDDALTYRLDIIAPK